MCEVDMNNLRGKAPSCDLRKTNQQPENPQNYEYSKPEEGPFLERKKAIGKARQYRRGDSHLDDEFSKLRWRHI